MQRNRLSRKPDPIIGIARSLNKSLDLLNSALARADRNTAARAIKSLKGRLSELEGFLRGADDYAQMDFAQEFLPKMSSRFVQISPKCIRLLKEVTRLIKDREIETFYRSTSSYDGAVPRVSVDRMLEKVNGIYWENTGLSQREKDALQKLYQTLKADVKQMGNSRVPRSPKSPSKQKPQLTLEEIKQRQQERRRSMSNLKQKLIRLGAQKPSLRPHLRPILASLKTARQDSFDIPIGSGGATVYFNLGFSEDNLQEDLEDPNAEVFLPGGPWTMEDYRRGDLTDTVLRLEHEILKKVGSLLGASRIGNEGHDRFGDLVCKFGIRNLKDLEDLQQKIQRNYGGGDDIIYFDHYFYIGDFSVFPGGVGVTSPIEFQDWDDYIDHHK